MQHAYGALGHARPIWLWLAVIAFLASLLGMAAAWAHGARSLRKLRVDEERVCPLRDRLAR